MSKQDDMCELAHLSLAQGLPFDALHDEGLITEEQFIMVKEFGFQNAYALTK